MRGNAASPSMRITSRSIVRAAMRAQGAGAGMASGSGSQPSSVAARKAALRAEMKKRLKSLSQEESRSESASIAGTLLGWSAFKSASNVGLYVSCPKLKEVQTDDLLEACLRENKAVFVPKVDGEGVMRMLKIERPSDLAPELPYGIPEPGELDTAGNPRAEATEEGLDVLVVPGVAFDDRGRRLGRGAGYYDRYLASYQARRRRPLVAAVCFSCQVVEEVPCEAHDMRMDAVLTPGEVLFGEGAAE